MLFVDTEGYFGSLLGFEANRKFRGCQEAVDWRTLMGEWGTLQGGMRKEPLRLGDVKHESLFGCQLDIATHPTVIARHDPTENDVQIEILFCGICHSDLHYARIE